MKGCSFRNTPHFGFYIIHFISFVISSSTERGRIFSEGVALKNTYHFISFRSFHSVYSLRHTFTGKYLFEVFFFVEKNHGADELYSRGRYFSHLNIVNHGKDISLDRKSHGADTFFD